MDGCRHLLLLTALAGCAGPRPYAYPPTRTTDRADVLHGTRVSDPYRWLEDAGSPEVRAWMKAQDDFARAVLFRLAEREAIRKRLAELLYVDSVTPPVRRADLYFFERRPKGSEKAILYIRKGSTGEDRVLLDPSAWSADGSVALTGWVPSWDGRKLAFRKNPNNSDDATLYVMDVGSGEVSRTDVIDGARYARPEWLPDGSGFFYQRLPTDPAIPETERPGLGDIRFHRLGTDPSEDEVVHGPTRDSAVFLDARLSPDGRWLLVDRQYGWTATDASFMDLYLPAGQRKLVPLTAGARHHYRASARLGRFFVATDEGASRYRVMSVDPAHPERDAWKEIVPEREDATLEGLEVIGGRLALLYLRNATSLLEVREPDGTFVRQVELPGLGTVTGPVGNADGDEAFFTFESFTRPAEVFVTSMETGATKLFAGVDVPTGDARYSVRQVSYPSRDGTRVSMFLVGPEEIPRDGSSRVMLYGYGGFQISLTPRFQAGIFPWLERGGVYALPNLRGGGEYGEQWHAAGMRERKQNVFDDFAAAMEYLVREGYTRPERLSIVGRSNGGLLVGASLVQFPALFAAGICGVPLLDMVRYHRVGAGTTWISEYGSADDPEQFRTLYAYSPYHHVRGGTAYPALLLSSADSDDRVDPMHARKFAAAVQAASAGGPVLLRIEQQAGHAGADLVRARVELYADELAFLLSATEPAR